MFRREAIEAKRQPPFGEIEVAAPVSGKFAAVIAAVMLLSAAALLGLGHYTDRERVQGQIVPTTGVLRVTAPAAGVVSKLLVIEGQVVHQGDALATVNGEVNTSLGGTRATISHELTAQRERLTADIAAQEHLATTQEAATRAKVTSLSRQVAGLRSEIAIAEREARNAESLLERMRPLREKGYLSAVQQQQQESTALQARSRVEELTRTTLESEQQIKEAQATLEQQPLTLQTKINDLRRQVSDLDRAAAENESALSDVIRAPADGTVVALPAREGQTVAAAEALMTILPSNAVLEGELLVPSRAAGFVHAGDRVVLRYDAYPYQKYGQQYGAVASVSRTALTREELQARAVKDGTQAVYRIAVKLDRGTVDVEGGAAALKPGMLFEADILKERRTLLEWAIAPMRGFSASVSQG